MGDEISEREWFEWRDYWMRSDVSVVEFVNSIRWAIGKDPLPHGRGGKPGGRAYYAEGVRSLTP